MPSSLNIKGSELHTAALAAMARLCHPGAAKYKTIFDLDIGHLSRQTYDRAADGLYREFVVLTLLGFQAGTRSIDVTDYASINSCLRDESNFTIIQPDEAYLLTFESGSDDDKAITIDLIEEISKVKTALEAEWRARLAAQGGTASTEAPPDAAPPVRAPVTEDVTTPSHSSAAATSPHQKSAHGGKSRISRIAGRLPWNRNA